MNSDDQFASEAPGPIRLEELCGGENVLIMSPTPGAETIMCGGLIAESCARGRPPYVVVLTDGGGPAEAPLEERDRQAGERERGVRRAVAELGLPSGRLLFVGFANGRLPANGLLFEDLVKGLELISWREDCNAICAPSPIARDELAAFNLSRAVAENQRLKLFGFGDTTTQVSQNARRLNCPNAAQAVKRAGVHVTWLDPVVAACDQGEEQVSELYFESFDLRFRP